jgi:glucokinase
VVGVPGPVSYAEGRIRRLPNLPAWQDSVSVESLSAELGLPALLANDADLAALGEHRFGAGAGTSDMVFMSSGTGVGGGVILGGRLIHGRLSLAEIGHTVIDWTTGETVEDLGSGSALERLFGHEGEDVTAAAAAGDAEAQAAVDRVAEVFSVGVHNLVHSFMPQRVVLGGGFALGASETVLARVRDRLEACDKGCIVRGEQVALALLGDDAGLRGAYALGRDTIDKG